MTVKVHEVYPGEPARVDIIHKRNDDFTLPIIGYDKNGDPKDFTNHTFLMQIKDVDTDDTFVVEIPDGSFTIGQNADGATAGVNNTVDIAHTDDDFDIEAKEYVYDIEMIDGSGKVTTIMEGTFTITQDVTRPIV